MKANEICGICQTNHGATDDYPGDNPCCPNCRHYNAILSRKCRDCGFTAQLAARGLGRNSTGWETV
jgi:hypothetical protein